MRIYMRFVVVKISLFVNLKEDFQSMYYNLKFANDIIIIYLESRRQDLPNGVLI
jgi:hypothetical protein